MKNLPIALIYSRLVIGLLLVGLAWLDVPHFAIIAAMLISVGLLTDIFDGIVARQLKVSTEKLRRLDSGVDQIFWGLVIATAYVRCEAFFAANATKLLLLLAFEGLTYLLSFLRFGKEVATHSWAAKLWVLVSFGALLQVITSCGSGVVFEACFYIGLLSRLEIIAIILALRQWANDVPSLYNALRLRQGKPILRHKLLN